MLKKTNVKLELMTDIDQVLFVESNIRGGLSYIGQRFCKKTPENEMLYIDGMYNQINFEIRYFALQKEKIESKNNIQKDLNIHSRLIK